MKNTINQISGIITSGRGEGKFYIKKYKNKIQKAINFIPYEGTLNLKIDCEQVKKFLQPLACKKIDGFTENDKRYGSAKIYQIKIDALKSTTAIVIPEKNFLPKNIIEIIAPINLRDALNLKDGDIIIIETI